jgi:hypothetical protein
MPKYNIDLTAELVTIERAAFTVEADDEAHARRIADDMLSCNPHDQAVYPTCVLHYLPGALVEWRMGDAEMEGDTSVDVDVYPAG